MGDNVDEIMYDTFSEDSEYDSDVMSYGDPNEYDEDDDFTSETLLYDLCKEAVEGEEVVEEYITKDVEYHLLQVANRGYMDNYLILLDVYKKMGPHMFDLLFLHKKHDFIMDVVEAFLFDDYIPFELSDDILDMIISNDERLAMNYCDFMNRKIFDKQLKDILDNFLNNYSYDIEYGGKSNNGHTIRWDYICNFFIEHKDSVKTHMQNNRDKWATIIVNACDRRTFKYLLRLYVMVFDDITNILRSLCGLVSSNLRMHHNNNYNISFIKFFRCTLLSIGNRYDYEDIWHLRSLLRNKVNVFMNVLIDESDARKIFDCKLPSSLVRKRPDLFIVPMGLKSEGEVLITHWKNNFLDHFNYMNNISKLQLI